MWTKFTTDDNDHYIRIPIDYNEIITGNPTLTGKQEEIINNYNRMIRIKAFKNDSYDVSKYIKISPYHFAYGYALTVWKAQGSEFPCVVAYDAPWLKKQNPDEYRKYLYTTVTRSSKTIILVGE